MKYALNRTLCVLFLAFTPALDAAVTDSLLYTIGYTEDLDIDRPLHSEQFTVELMTSAARGVIRPDDLSATCRIAWNRDHLLLVVDVRDNDLHVSRHNDRLWEYDSVEVFIAPQLGGNSYYQLVMAVDKEGTLRSAFYDFRETQLVPLAFEASAQRTPAGYRILAKLPWSNIGPPPEADNVIAMQLFINDAAPDKEATQLQWYPHAVSHSSDRMHRLKLCKASSDKHLTACLVHPGYDYHRLDIVIKEGYTFSDVEVADEKGRKMAAGCFHDERYGLRKAAVLLPIAGLNEPAVLRFIADGRTIGQTVVSAPSTFGGELLKQLQNITLAPKSKWGYLFETGTEPQVVWSSPNTMKAACGSETPDVRWFNNTLTEVTSFDTSGRYIAVAEARLLDGTIIRRSTTFYAISPDAHPWRFDPRLALYNRTRPWWHPWRGKPCAQADYIPGFNITPTAWQQYSSIISARAGKEFFEFVESDPYGPVLLSFLSEAEVYAAHSEKTRTPEIVDNDIHLALKRKLLNLPVPPPALRKPERLPEDRLAPCLKEGTAEQAGFKPESIEAIRHLCRQWFQADREPFVVLVARNGVIFFHEAFGDQRRPVNTDTPMFMASITKCMSGLLLARFVDQGLIELDQPVGDFLVDFPVTGDKAITFRHCFTHTAGFRGHYEFGGMHNPWLENALSLELASLPVGRIHEYNGMGYDLAGKAMEIAGGKSAFRLMHEDLFEPLGMTHTHIDDMATCSTATALDIARLGQLLLNKGSYGDLRFFSEETFEKILPVDLSSRYPAVQKNWGIGFTWMLQRHPQPNESGQRYLFSNRVLGHGAASSAIFRVDLENKLVIVQTRDIAGSQYDDYMLKFLTLIDDLMER